MKKLVLLFTMPALLFTNCGGSEENNNEKQTKEEKVVIVEKEIIEEPEVEVTINADSAIQAINAKRAQIESELADPTEVPTTELREKIKQKWSKIHFYSVNGNVVRIKTYPYEQISKRTEEFYFNNGQLMLVIIEDNGEGEKGKTSEEIEKLYYYNNGEFFDEENHTSENEYKIKDSDAEELAQEAKEYLDIFRTIK